MTDDTQRREQIAREVYHCLYLPGTTPSFELDTAPIYFYQQCDAIADLIIQREAALYECLLEGWPAIHREHNSREPVACEPEVCQGALCTRIRQSLEWRTP